MDMDDIRPFLKYMYKENNAVWVGQLSYREFIRRSDLDEYKRIDLEVPNSIIFFLYNKNTHKLYTRGKASTDEIIKVMRNRINDI